MSICGNKVIELRDSLEIWFKSSNKIYIEYQRNMLALACPLCAVLSGGALLPEQLGETGNM